MREEEEDDEDDDEEEVDDEEDEDEEEDELSGAEGGEGWGGDVAMMTALWPQRGVGRVPFVSGCVQCIVSTERPHT